MPYTIRDRRRFVATTTAEGGISVRQRRRRRSSGLGLSAELMAAQGAVREQIEAELERRAQPASQEIVNAAARTLGKRGKGRRYRIPGSRRRYRASMPKSPPAKRTGALAASWSPSPRKYKRYTEGMKITVPGSTTDMDWLAKILTKGAIRKRGGLLVHRPFKRKVKQSAMRKIRRIYREPYLQRR